jgi:hypothetical protein
MPEKPDPAAASPALPPTGLVSKHPTEELGPVFYGSPALPTLLETLIAKWRRSADLTEAEIASGLRAKHSEGPRYGIATVRQCADDLEAALAMADALESWLNNHDVPLAEMVCFQRLREAALAVASRP